MVTCPACARSVVIASALWCPHCGVSLSDAGTRTATGPTASRYPPLDDARFAPGLIFASRYRIVSLLGRGAMGEVYRADDTRLGQPIALKLLTFHGTRGPGTLKRFADEVRLARGIAHPNVCRVYDIGEAEGWQYLSMEYVDGETLESLVRRIGRLPITKALEIARQLFAGVAAAHDRGILHRDLKPSNIMLDGRGLVRILDFGLAVSTAEGTVREVAGTPAYMAPEQVVGGRINERTDLFALGLILYELFAGRRFFAAQTIADRLNLRDPQVFPAFDPDIDPQIAGIIRACLEDDPAARPRTALSVAAMLPGGDPLEAAVAEGRVPSPAMVAAASRRGTLPLPIAWALLAAAIIGAAGVASQGHVLTIPPSALPKSPQVLVEHSREVLVRIGDNSSPVDSEAWFAAVANDTAPTAVRFVYRQSPRPLVPANLFRIVNETDPPADVPGMASVTLDASGRLIGFSRISETGGAHHAGGPTADPAALFREAGLDEHDFVRVEPDRTPLVPHDEVVMWARRSNGSTSGRVTAATLAGSPVFFTVGDYVPPALRFHGVLGSGRRAAADAFLSVFVISGFILMAVMAQRNLRAGEGDRGGARTLTIFVVCGGVLHFVIRAHHVPVVQDEIVAVLGLTGWALVWGGFSWLAYVSFEPYVRRLWPGTLISWTRLLHGRARDPLVGRDVLAGALGGVVLAGLLIVQLRLIGGGSPDELLGSALENLRSSRQTAAVFTWSVLDGVQFALGELFFVLLVRMLIRKTWAAVGVLLVLGTPLIVGSASGLVGFLGAVAIAGVALTILLRIGLLAYAVTLMCERILRHVPLTLDPHSWYFGSSVLMLLLVATIAGYGFIVSLGGYPVFGEKSTNL